ncbi:MAG: two-component system response regulator [Desulfobacteraceae bacterium IS3]|nr:MAG: two-component system response regulator [Desulfobacteraceae bacterium IS3]
MNILFVDDEEDFRETLLKRMKKRKVNASGVSSGEEALEFLKQNENETDVVVLDVRMKGGMDGIRALKEIKTLHPRLEVIMLTGHASLEVAKEGMEIGAFDYLMKPVDVDDLLYKLQDAYKKKKIQEEKIKKIGEVIEAGK